MNRFSKVTGIAESPKSVVWGMSVGTKAIVAGSFAALLLVSSITVGCSKSDSNAKPQSSTSQIPMMPPQTVASNSTIPLEGVKPAVKKVQHKRPVTKTFADKTYGVSFDYPRKYELEAGDKASDLLASGPMKSEQNGGVALAAVQMPESVFPNTDFAGAFFGVSVNKDLNVVQCTGAENKPEDVKAEEAKPEGVKTEEKKASDTTPQAIASVDDPSKQSPINTELHATETVSGEGARQNDVKYFRTFQNGACYEFALNVTTVGNNDAAMKHVDRDRVFDRLEKILATVKIAPTVAEPVPAAQTTASLPSATPTETPAQ